MKDTLVNIPQRFILPTTENCLKRWLQAHILSWTHISEILTILRHWGFGIDYKVKETESYEIPKLFALGAWNKSKLHGRNLCVGHCCFTQKENIRSYRRKT